MTQCEFSFHAVANFPIVRVQMQDLPVGYARA
jgi:hypothetical protein